MIHFIYHFIISQCVRDCDPISPSTITSVLSLGLKYDITLFLVRVSFDLSNARRSTARASLAWLTIEAGRLSKRNLGCNGTRTEPLLEVTSPH